MEGRGSEPPGLSDSTESSTAGFSESTLCNLDLWRSGGGSISALGFSLDRFRGPMKKMAKDEDRV